PPCIRGVIPAEPPRTFRLLGQFSFVLPAAHGHPRCGGRVVVFLGGAAERSAMEPRAATWPHVALHLLDSRGDGVRARLASHSQDADVAGGLDRLRRLLRVHARVLGCKGSLRRPVATTAAYFFSIAWRNC